MKKLAKIVLVSSLGVAGAAVVYVNSYAKKHAPVLGPGPSLENYSNEEDNNE